MTKFKVRFYEDARVIEKEVEASGFYMNKDSEGKSATFYDRSDGSKEPIHAFSSFVSIKKI